MAAVLNSNIASLYASKNLQSAQSKMANSVERLSSGLRINRAKDDAAGLGIANALTQQINGANQGVRNLNDGISMVQTAEGSIAAAQEMAQRILTLATQGANGTLGTTERTAIKSEMTQLLTAIDGINKRTKFSSNSLLNVDVQAAVVTNKFSLQASNVTSDVVALSSNAFKNIGGSVATTSSVVVTSATATLNTTEANRTATATVGNGATGTSTVYATKTLTLAGTYAAGDTIALTNVGSSPFTYTVTSADVSGANATANLALIATSIASSLGSASGSTVTGAANAAQVTITHNAYSTAFSPVSTVTKYSSTYTSTTHPQATARAYTLTAGIDSTVATGTAVYVWKANASSSVDGSYTLVGYVSGFTNSGATLTIDADPLADVGTSDKIIFGSNSGLLTQELSATNGDLSLTQAIASTTNDTANFQMVQRAADGYITALSTQRSLLGAYQNQIEYTVSNVNELSSNLSAARSNVQDTDYASETASLTKGQILQQAATAMLAQANQMPNVILSLLK